MRRRRTGRAVRRAAGLGLGLARQCVIARPDPNLGLLLGLALLAGLLFAQPAAAVTRIWTGAGADNNWGTAGNWDTGVPASGLDDVRFPPVALQKTNVNNLAANFVVTGITFIGGDYSISGINVLDLGGNIQNDTGLADNAISFPIRLTATRTVTVDLKSRLTLSGIISESVASGLSKAGLGTLVLSGNNSYTGVNTVSAGTLRATTSVNALGLGTATTTVTLSGGTLELADDGAGGALNFGRNTTVSASSTIVSDRVAAGAGVTHTLGTLSIGAFTLTINAGSNVTSGTAGVTFGTTTLTGIAVFDTAASTNLTLGAVGGAFAFTKQGSGQMTLKTAATRATSATTLTAGTLRLEHANALDTGAATLTINGGTLSLGVDANTTFNGANVAGSGTATVEVDRATSGAGPVTHTLGTLSIGARQLNVTRGSLMTSGTAGLTFGTTTLSASGAVFNSSTNAKLTLPAVSGLTFSMTVTGAGDTDITGIIGTSTGTLTKSGTGILTLTAANTYSGATTINAGTLTLSGSGTAITSAFTVNAGGTLTLDNSGANVLSRLSDTLALTLKGGAFNFIGAAVASETAGALTLSSGSNAVTVTPGAGGSTTMTFASLARTAGATVLFRGTSLGSAPAANVSTVIFTAAPTLTGGAGAADSTIISIIKGAIGDALLTGTGTDMVTYNVGNTNGLRLLNGAGFTTEYATALTTCTASMNVKLAAASTPVACTINSLVLNSGGSVPSSLVTLTVGSGNVLNLSTTGAITNTTVLDFGANEGIVWSTVNSLAIDSNITGTGGLTKDGTGTLTFSGVAKAYTGTTTVAAGTLTVGAADMIADASPVTVSGGTLSLGANSDTVGTVTLTSGMIAGTTGVLTSSATYAVQDGTISAVLAGAVGLTKSTTGTVTLSGLNTYTGLTTVSSGTLTYGADNVIADTANVTVSGGTLDIGGYNDTVGTVTLNDGSITGGTGTLTGTVLQKNLNATTATLNANMTVASLTVNITGGTLNLGTGKSHTVNGDVTVTVGTLNLGSSTLTVNGNVTVTTATTGILNGGSSGTLNLTGNLTGAGTFTLYTAGTVLSTVDFSGATAQTIAAGATAFYHLSHSGTGTATLGAATTVNGSLTIASGELAKSTYALTVVGNLLVNGTLSGSVGITLGTAISTIDGTGSITNTGLTTISSSHTVLSTANLFFAGSVTISAGTLTNNGIIVLDVPTTLTVTGTLANKRKVDGYVMSVGTGGFTNWDTVVASDLQGLGTFTNQVNATLNIDGNATITTLTATATPNNIVVYFGTAAQTVKGTTYNNLRIDNVGATATLGAITTVNGDLTVVAGGTLSNAAVALTVAGNLTVDGTLTGTTADITLNGANKTIGGGGSITPSTAGTDLIITANHTILSTATLTVSRLITVSGATTVVTNNGIVTTSTNGISGSIAGATWVNAANSTLSVAGPLLTLAGTVLTASANPNTVNYNGTTAAQTVKAESATYYHLKITTLGFTATLGSAISQIINVAGNLTIGDETNATTVTAATYNPAINITGNLTLNDLVTFNKGSGTLTLSGTTGATWADKNTTKRDMGTVVIGDGSAKTVTLSSSVKATTVTITAAATLDNNQNTLTLTGIDTPFVTGGTLDAESGTVEYVGAAATNITAATYYNLSVKPGGASVTHTFLAGTVTVNGNFTAGDGTTTGAIVTANANPTTLTVSGNFTISANTTFTANGANPTAVGGSWSNSGTFTAGTGTVTLNGATKQTLSVSGSGTMTGSSAFYNLTITNSSGTTSPFVPSVSFSNPATATNIFEIITSSVEVQFAAGQTYTFTNINLAGATGSGNAVTLRSSSTGSSTPADQWKLVVNNITPQVVNYVDVQNSNASDGNTIVANSTDTSSGNNLNWAFGGTCTSNVTTGDWGTPGTWDCGSVPGPTNAVIIRAGDTITLNVSATIVSLVLNAGATAAVLTHSGTACSGPCSLTVNGPVTIKQPTGAATNAWNINAGTASVAGNVLIGGTNTTADFLAKVAVTTGSLTISQNLIYNSSSTTAGTAVVDLSGGIAATLNLGGALTLTNGTGTLTPGTSSTVVYNGTGAQTVTIASAITYNNLTINKVSGTATLGAAITTGNVANNLSVLGGTFNNGGFAITGNAGKTFEVANGATFVMTGTSGIPTGFTITLGATSTVDYGGGAQTVSLLTYGHLSISGTGTKSEAATGTITVQGNLTVGTGPTFNIGFTGGITLTVNGTTTVSGTLAHTVLGGTKTYTGLVTVNQNGTWNNNTINEAIIFRGGITNHGTFNTGSGIQTFDTTNSQNIGGSAAITIANLTITGVTLTNTGTLTVNTGLLGTGTLNNGPYATLNIGVGSVTPALTATAVGNTVVYNGTVAQTVKSATYYNLTILTNYSVAPVVTFSTGGTTATGTATITPVNNKQVNFNAGQTYAFTNINFDGGTLRSTTSGSPWYLVVTGTQTVLNTNVQDSNACNGDSIDATDTTNTNNGNNPCWAFSPAAIGGARLVYGEGTVATPRTRFYDNPTASWSTEGDTTLGTATVAWVVSKESPTEDVTVMATQSTTGVLDVFCRSGSAWTKDFSISSTSTPPSSFITTAPIPRQFDLEFDNQSISSIPMVLYSKNVSGTNELGYRRKTGAGCGAGQWTTESTIDPTRVTTVVRWIELEARRTSGSNVMAAAFSDANATAGGKLEAMIWDGTLWGNESLAGAAQGWSDLSIELLGTAGANGAKVFDLAFESLSGDLIVGWGTSIGTALINGWRYATCAAALPCTWSGVKTPTGPLDDATMVDAAPDPASDAVAFIAIGNAGSDLSAWLWTGSAVGAAVDNADSLALLPASGYQLVGIDWVVKGSQRMAVGVYANSVMGYQYIYYDTVGNAWRTNAATGFPVTISPATIGLTRHIEVLTDPFDNTTLLALETDANADLWAKRLRYNGAAVINNTTALATWSNTEGGAALETTVSSIVNMPFWFDYSRTTIAPTISSVRDNSSDCTGTVITKGRADDTINICGSNFQTAQGVSTVTINGAAAKVKSWSASQNQITAIVPVDGTITGNIVVRVLGKNSNSFPFTITPRITGRSPGTGSTGVSVTITGDHFGTVAVGGRDTGTCGVSTGNAVCFGGTKVTDVNVTSWTDAEIKANVPSVSGTVAILVKYNGNNSEDPSPYSYIVGSDPYPGAYPNEVSSLSVIDPITGNRLDLSWQNPSAGDFAGVKISRSTSATPAATCTADVLKTLTAPPYNTPNKIVAYADLGLRDFDTSYYYRICTFDDFSTPNVSNGVAPTPTPVTPTDKTPPANVTNLAVDSGGDGKTLALTWTNPTDADFGDVLISRAPGALAPPDCSTFIGTVTAPTTFYDDTSLLAGTYSYRVCSRDEVPNISSGVTASSSVTTRFYLHQAEVLASGLPDDEQGTLTACTTAAGCTWFDAKTIRQMNSTRGTVQWANFGSTNGVTPHFARFWASPPLAEGTIPATSWRINIARMINGDPATANMRLNTRIYVWHAANSATGLGTVVSSTMIVAPASGSPIIPVNTDEATEEYYESSNQTGSPVSVKAGDRLIFELWVELPTTGTCAASPFCEMTIFYDGSKVTRPPIPPTNTEVSNHASFVEADITIPLLSEPVRWFLHNSGTTVTGLTGVGEQSTEAAIVTWSNDSGEATTPPAPTATTLTDNTKTTWITNQWVGATITMTSGIAGNIGLSRGITANTTTGGLTFSAFPNTIAAGDKYTITNTVYQMRSDIGTDQVTVSNPGTTGGKHFIRFFAGPPLIAQTIPAQAWNFNAARSESNTGNDFMTRIFAYVWRPPSSLVGKITATPTTFGTAGTAFENSAAGDEEMIHGGFEGQQVTVQTGDRVILEWWGSVAAQSVSTLKTYYDGGTLNYFPNSPRNSSVGSIAAFLEPTAGLSFLQVDARLDGQGLKVYDPCSPSCTGTAQVSAKDVVGGQTTPTLYHLQVRNEGSAPQNFKISIDSSSPPLASGWVVEINADGTGSNKCGALDDGTGGAGGNFGLFPGSGACQMPNIAAGGEASFDIKVTPPGSPANQEIVLKVAGVGAALAAVDAVKASASVIAAPSNPLLATGTDPTFGASRSINIRWLDNSNNEAGFYVERAVRIGADCITPTPAFTRIAATPPGVGGYAPGPGVNDYYTDNNNGVGLVPSTFYCYRVQAHTAEEVTSAFSLAAFFSTGPGAADTIAPAAVTDLTVVANEQRAKSVSLRWTAPYEDSGPSPPTNPAKSYDLRYAMVTIQDGAADGDLTHVHFDDLCDAADENPAVPKNCVVKVIGLPAPSDPGKPEFVTVTGSILQAGTTRGNPNECDVTLAKDDPLTGAVEPLCLTPNTIYFFALKTSDDDTIDPLPTPNTSPISNIAGGDVTEVAGDGIGNDNGICETGDTCVDGGMTGRTSLRTNFNLVSVPGIATIRHPWAVFGDDVGEEPILQRWNSTGLLAKDGCYYEYPGPSSSSNCTALDFEKAQGKWSFSEGPGNITTADSTTNNNILSFVGTNPWVASSNDGQTGYGLDLDGAKEYATIANASQTGLNMRDEAIDGNDNDNGICETNETCKDASFVLQAWVYRNETGSEDTIVSKRSSSGGPGYRLFINTDGKLELTLQGSGSAVPVTGTTTIGSGTWYFVKAIVDRTTQYAQLFVKNLPEGSPPQAQSISTLAGDLSNSTNFSIGANGTTADFKGKIDEVKVATFNPIKPGEGYFLQGGAANPVIDLPSRSTAVTLTGDCVANSYNIPLQKGWNMIASPFFNNIAGTAPAYVNLSAAYVRQNGTTCNTWATAVAPAGWVGNSIYSFNGSTYDAATTSSTPPAFFEPWKGYWLYVADAANTYELILQRPP